MTKERQAYTEEFRGEAVRRDQPGNTAASVATELGLHPGSGAGIQQYVQVGWLLG